MPIYPGPKMVALNGLFRHQMEHVGAGNITWTRPVKSKMLGCYGGTAAVLRIFTLIVGIHPGPYGVVLIFFIAPSLACFMYFKRLKSLQRRTTVEAASGKAFQALSANETHGLVAKFEGVSGFLRFAGIKLIEMFLPHTALRPRFLYADGPLLFTTDGRVYVGFVRDTVPHNLPTMQQRGSGYSSQLGLWKERLRLGGGLEQIMIYRPPFDVDSWQRDAEQMVVRSPDSVQNHPGPAGESWRDLIAAEADQIREMDFRPRRVLHYQQLGRRQARPSRSITQAMRRLIQQFNYVLEARDEVPSSEEIAHWRGKSQQYQAIFHRYQGEPMTTDDLFDCIVHHVWRGFTPTGLPKRPGGASMVASDFRRLLGSGPIRVRGKREARTFDVRVFNDEVVYVAHLVITIPDVAWQGAGNEILYITELLPPANINGQDARVYADVTVVGEYFDHIEGTNRLRRKIEYLASQIDHYEEHNIAPKAEWQEQLAIGGFVVPDIKSGHDALMSTTFVVTVEGKSIPEVNEKIAVLRQQFGELEVEHPGDLQQQLSAMTMPASESLVPAFRQWINAGMLAGSGMLSAIRVGSKGVGHFLGYVTRGGDRPVFYNPLEARHRNMPGGVAEGGDQGGGKSQTGKRFGIDNAKLGIPGIMLDLKNKESDRMMVIPDVNVEIWNLTGDEPGQLDPYVNFPKGDASRPAFETFETLLGRHGGRQLDLELNKILRQACREADELETDRSMLRVVEILERSDEGHAMASHFRELAEYDLGKLFFAPAALTPRVKIPEFMCVQVTGIVLPDDGVQPDHFTDTNWLSIAVVNGIGYKIMSLAYSLQIPNLFVFFDETHILEKTNVGDVLMEKTARFSRYMGIIPDIASQGIGELERYGRHFRQRMIFRVADPNEQAAALRFIGLPDTPDNREMLTNLADGECFYRDLDGFIVTMQVVTPFQIYEAAFDTTLNDEEWHHKYAVGTDARHYQAVEQPQMAQV